MCLHFSVSKLLVDITCGRIVTFRLCSTDICEIRKSSFLKQTIFGNIVFFERIFKTIVNNISNILSKKTMFETMFETMFVN